jgi:hypothetical protein
VEQKEGEEKIEDKTEALLVEKSERKLDDPNEVKEKSFAEKEKSERTSDENNKDIPTGEKKEEKLDSKQVDAKKKYFRGDGGGTTALIAVKEDIFLVPELCSLYDYQTDKFKVFQLSPFFFLFVLFLKGFGFRFGSGFGIRIVFVSVLCLTR